MDHLINLKHIHLNLIPDKQVVDIIKSLDKDLGQERMSRIQLTWVASYKFMAEDIIAEGERISYVPAAIRKRFANSTLKLDVNVDDEGLGGIIEEVGKLNSNSLELTMSSSEPKWHMCYKDLYPPTIGRLESLYICGDYVSLSDVNNMLANWPTLQSLILELAFTSILNGKQGSTHCTNEFISAGRTSDSHELFQQLCQSLQKNTTLRVLDLYNLCTKSVAECMNSVETAQLLEVPRALFADSFRSSVQT
ncbi:hypothetical protein SAMD00019534_076450 [Acytostelium subglobosum LB1]|uniref:hypothetical protein n=1 Tax=Acytostelium subglobosum LB1 TaxID=1410327 RepID=UPI0006450532|nr:hypothetical protein SAMD00019534_076450 [Acytostelium subglobosum LB1]GAM24470.1 hypothetical protein SAMD00019534_076450 [Acytostelium subglobosum LB1]|eukprot:XP_012752796.1 hypothetical protein SAMD00019534_076450 [Acytostelium subglobosum LB1]